MRILEKNKVLQFCKKTKPEEKSAFSCGSSALIMSSLYKADTNFLPMEHVNKLFPLAVFLQKRLYAGYHTENTQKVMAKFWWQGSA